MRIYSVIWRLLSVFLVNLPLSHLQAAVGMCMMYKTKINERIDMNENRPYILVTNDDGIDAPGIGVLIEALRPMADLIVMAPDGARSGFGMSITSAHPLWVKKVSEEEGCVQYACSGTPVDCVKVALNKYVTREVDLVVSGVNHGDNSSVNCHYSGTMGAAMEAALQGISAVGFSLDDMSHKASMAALSAYIAPLAKKALAMNLPAFTCLNVNFPAVEKFEGVKVCRMAKSRWVKELEDCDNGGRSADWYWLGGHCEELEAEAEDTDRWALAHGYVAITPTTLDNTAYGLMEGMADWSE